jgi:hypothetical protein
MIAFIARFTLVALLFGSQVGLTIAGGPPKLNIDPSCEAAARSVLSLGRDTEACRSDERDAENLLVKNWSLYSGAHKTQCVDMTSRGGSSSYVELISCLDIMRDAAAIHKADPLFGEKTPKEHLSNASASTRRSPKRSVLPTRPIQSP